MKSERHNREAVGDSLSNQAKAETAGGITFPDFKTHFSATEIQRDPGLQRKQCQRAQSSCHKNKPKSWSGQGFLSLGFKMHKQKKRRRTNIS